MVSLDEMSLTSLQVCMDSTHWLEDSIHDDSGMDSSSNSPSGDMLGCPRPLMERRLRPQHDQPLKCPRCDSAHTKFCYYNNYSLSQPRYFCKTCRRYWTKGGTLRNIPVGGGCRKNKKVSSSKKPTDNHHNQMMNMPNPGSASSSRSPTDLQLAFPHDMHFTSHINSLLGSNTSFCTNPSSFMEAKFGSAPGPIDFMEGKLEALVGSNTRNNNNSYDFMGNNVVDQVQFGDLGVNGFGLNNFNGLCSPFVVSNSMIDPNRVEPSFIMDPSYSHGPIDVKPNPKLLSLEWQDQNCSDVGKNGQYNIGYNNFNSLGSSWSVNMMNDFGSSATNPLV